MLSAQSIWPRRPAFFSITTRRSIRRPRFDPARADPTARPSSPGRTRSGVFCHLLRASAAEEDGNEITRRQEYAACRAARCSRASRSSVCRCQLGRRGSRYYARNRIGWGISQHRGPAGDGRGGARQSEANNSGESGYGSVTSVGSDLLDSSLGISGARAAGRSVKRDGKNGRKKRAGPGYARVSSVA